MSRAILLVDMNAFFASVHQALDPGLRGKPVIVAGDPARRHGIVLAASYEARAKGVKTGLTVAEARLACPEGIFIKPQHDLYVRFSARILRILHDFTPLVEPFSIDEAFLDVTGCHKLLGSPVEIAHRLKARIRQEVGITCSVGIGPNKLLAKMAAELQKPDGLTQLTFEDVPRRLWPLPVRELFGVGPRYEEHLRKLNIHTIGDLANFPVDVLKRRFGAYGEALWFCARGIDHSPVDPGSLKQVKSIGQQITLPRDYRGEEIKVVLWELADRVARRARAGEYAGRTVVLSLKDTRFNWLSRRKTLPFHTSLAGDIYRAAADLLEQHWSPHWPVRLVGLALGGLTARLPEQLTLFGERERRQRAEQACDAIKKRYGEKAIFRAVSLTPAGVFYTEPPRTAPSFLMKVPETGQMGVGMDDGRQ
ncbi:DNA polymerase IV [Desulfofundulus sp. TPOSR]|uniref:DNA polymerase IV n=1 Tax=Desulfofundulus kuznetsovii (strain DSM 6115 / VKM B-1805 / 17) TaxID=760568 RepID=A0AAU8P9M6_DESK7|nr:DNA polymerase IV [Desulfofundulus sp. TPOSR]AEG13835.1 DNA polymerase IV [Desulfofundulus kuznetsovii DSM 6115]NHM26536.1 DNA polymerase IV [Desulfofundulus sp. TPOSR]